MPGMKIWDEKFADDIDDDKFYFHLLIFRPQISHIFQNSMLFFRISLWIEDVALGRDFDFFSPRQSCSIGRPAGKKDKKSMAWRRSLL